MNPAEATRAAHAMRSGVQSPGREDVSALVEEIFARPEFQAQKSPWDTWLSDLVEAIGRWLEGTGIDGSLAGRVAATVVYGILIGIAAVVVFHVARALLAARAARTRASGDAALPVHAGKVFAQALCREARAAYERGDHRAAVRLYFRALVIGLSEHGHLVYRESWTNRELVVRGAPPKDLEPVLHSLLPHLDAQSFGHVAVGPADVERWSALVRRHLPGVHA